MGNKCRACQDTGIMSNGMGTLAEPLPCAYCEKGERMNDMSEKKLEEHLGMLQWSIENTASITDGGFIAHLKMQKEFDGKLIAEIKRLNKLRK